jgi:hypothetical protein
MKKTIEFDEATLLRSMREALAHARRSRAHKTMRVAIASSRKQKMKNVGREGTPR